MSRDPKWDALEDDILDTSDKLVATEFFRTYYGRNGFEKLTAFVRAQANYDNELWHFDHETITKPKPLYPAYESPIDELASWLSADLGPSCGTGGCKS
jgi:hypothetical protein